MKWIFILILSLTLLVGCNDTRQYDSFIKEHTADQQNHYNLYIYYKDNAEEIKEFSKQFNPESHMHIQNVRSYGINELSTTYRDLAGIDENNTPMYILFNDEEIELKTDNLDHLLSHIDSLK